MKYINFDLLVLALKEKGIDDVYEKLEKLFLEDAIAIIDRCGSIVFTPFDSEDIYTYLESLYENLIGGVNYEEE